MTSPPTCVSRCTPRPTSAAWRTAACSPSWRRRRERRLTTPTRRSASTASPSPASLPKVELHCHLEGAAGPSTIADLPRTNGVDPPVEDPAELFEFTSLNQFLAVYDVICASLRTADDFRRITYEALEDAVAAGVRYREMFFSPGFVAGPRRAGRDGVGRASGPGSPTPTHDLDISCRMILDFDKPAGAAARGRDGRVRRPRRTATCSSAWAATPSNAASTTARSPPRSRAPAGSGCAARSTPARTARPTTSRIAIDELGCERIDHGFRLLDDADLTAGIADARIPLTVCPTSNVVIANVVADVADHPFARQREAGVLVTLNSDDPGMMGFDDRRRVRGGRRRVRVRLRHMEDIASTGSTPAGRPTTRSGHSPHALPRRDRRAARRRARWRRERPTRDRRAGHRPRRRGPTGDAARTRSDRRGRRRGVPHGRVHADRRPRHPRRRRSPGSATRSTGSSRLPMADKRAIRRAAARRSTGATRRRVRSGSATASAWSRPTTCSRRSTSAPPRPTSPHLDLDPEIYAENIWPDDRWRVAFRDAASRRGSPHAGAVARRMTEIFAAALGLPDDHFAAVHRPLDRRAADEQLRRARPASRSAPSQLGMGAHTDYGIVTVLWADPVPGLEILRPDGTLVARRAGARRVADQPRRPARPLVERPLALDDAPRRATARRPTADCSDGARRRTSTTATPTR